MAAPRAQMPSRRQARWGGPLGWAVGRPGLGAEARAAAGRCAPAGVDRAPARGVGHCRALMQHRRGPVNNGRSTVWEHALEAQITPPLPDPPSRPPSPVPRGRGQARQGDPRVVLKDLDLGGASFKIEAEWHARLMEQVRGAARPYRHKYTDPIRTRKLSLVGAGSDLPWLQVGKARIWVHAAAT
jgi:hypothetical protein